MHDFDELLAACHSAGLKVLLDLVPNHTSAQHPWFWKAGRPPTIQSAIGSYGAILHQAEDLRTTGFLNSVGRAGNTTSRTGQYYYHTFLKEQPDLNWRCPEVREAIHDVMRFWLERGVDGFRADAIWYLLKDEQFVTIHKTPTFGQGRTSATGTDTTLHGRPSRHPCHHQRHAARRRRISKRVLLGEIYLPIERIMAYYGRDLDGTHFPSISVCWRRGRRGDRALDLEKRSCASAWGWPNWVLGNHDRPRVATRVGPDQAESPPCYF